MVRRILAPTEPRGRIEGVPDLALPMAVQGDQSGGIRGITGKVEISRILRICPEFAREQNLAAESREPAKEAIFGPIYAAECSETNGESERGIGLSAKFGLRNLEPVNEVKFFTLSRQCDGRRCDPFCRKIGKFRAGRPFPRAPQSQRAAYHARSRRR